MGRFALLVLHGPCVTICSLQTVRALLGSLACSGYQSISPLESELTGCVCAHVSLVTIEAGRRDWAATDSDSDFHGPAPSRIDSVVSRLGSSVILGQNSAHTDPDQPSDTQANSMATKTVKSASAGGALISNRSTRGLLEGGLSSMFSSYSGVMAAAAGARGTPLPSSAVASHWTQRGLLAEVHDCVSVIFMDLVGFTSHAQMMSADAVMRMLDTLYCRLDDLCLATGNKVYKVSEARVTHACCTHILSTMLAP